MQKGRNTEGVSVNRFIDKGGGAVNVPAGNLDRNTEGVSTLAVNQYVAKVFGWMFIGLLVTCLSTAGIFAMMGSEWFADIVYGLTQIIIVVFIVELIMVYFISSRINKMNPALTVALYLIYAALNGLTVGFFAVIYARQTAILAFGLTAVCFGIMALYGFFTQADLTKAGSLLMMGLIGIIIMSVVNLFLGSGLLDYLICIAGLFIFLGLTAYDTKKIKTVYAPAALQAESTGEYSGQVFSSNLAISGALALYLDFINLFLFIIRLLGGRGRS
ncbi:MAG: Bax inhibitor-1/YccA family protein [Defluviitaleaceae bacterium]|nr:Bax inhibitor-1/YccA family protein [Defluviitaleaceae bacterium]